MAFLVAQNTTEALQAGPFLSALDGVTLRPDLVITPADIQLSVNGGPLHAMTGSSNAVYSQRGYYTFTLGVNDTSQLGTTRIVIQMTDVLPVWLDILVVQPTAYATLAGSLAAPLLLVNAPATLALGAFVDSTDGLTVQNSLIITAANITISKNDGTFTTTTGTAPAAPLGRGHYAVTLPAADLNTLGTLRLSIELSGSLPVWLDVIVIPQAAWDLYFTPSPAVVVPPGPSAPPAPIPPGVRVAGSLFTSIAAGIDDPQQLRATSPGLLLHVLSRAQQWVALRYRLLVDTFSLTLLPGVPWYVLAQQYGRMIVVTDVTDTADRMLNPVPLTRLRYVDPQWLYTAGLPRRFWRLGWTHLGFYPVPTTYETAHVTGVVMPHYLVEATQLLETPASYDDAVVAVATGHLLMTVERKPLEGLAMIADALKISLPQAQQVAQGVAAG